MNLMKFSVKRYEGTRRGYHIEQIINAQGGDRKINHNVGTC